jgi:hypothetical protein
MPNRANGANRRISMDRERHGISSILWRSPPPPFGIQIPLLVDCSVGGKFLSLSLLFSSLPPLFCSLFILLYDMPFVIHGKITAQQIDPSKISALAIYLLLTGPTVCV